MYTCIQFNGWTIYLSVCLSVSPSVSLCGSCTSTQSLSLSYLILHVNCLSPNLARALFLCVQEASLDTLIPEQTNMAYRMHDIIEKVIVYIHIYIYMYVYIHVCIHICVCIYTYMHTYIGIYIYLRIYVFVSICMFVYSSPCIYIGMFICARVYFFMYLCIYSCIYVYVSRHTYFAIDTIQQK